MRIANLTDSHGKIYTCNVYLIRGDWNAIADVNTLIDVGSDPAVIDRIKAIPTGVGKKAVDQVILTHGHSDHTAILPAIRETFDPVVCAFSRFAGADELLEDGQMLRIGDRMFEIMHTPGHSSDSVCLYCESDGVLFSGDTPVIIRSSEGSYRDDFVRVLEELCCKNVQTIYSGHGAPIARGGADLICESLGNVRKARSTSR